MAWVSIVSCGVFFQSSVLTGTFPLCSLCNIPCLGYFPEAFLPSWQVSLNLAVGVWCRVCVCVSRSFRTRDQTFLLSSFFHYCLPFFYQEFVFLHCSRLPRSRRLGSGGHCGLGNEIKPSINKAGSFIWGSIEVPDTHSVQLRTKN